MTPNTSKCCEKCEERQQIGCPDNQLGCCVFHCKIVCKNLSCSCHTVPTGEKTTLASTIKAIEEGKIKVYPDSLKESWEESFDSLVYIVADSITDRDGVVDSKESLHFKDGIEPLKSFITATVKEAEERGRNEELSIWLKLCPKKMAEARAEGYEKGQDDAFRGKIENMSSISIKETVNVPVELQEYFKKQEREALKKKIEGMRKDLDNITVDDMNHSVLTAYEGYNQALDDIIKSL